MNTAHLPNSTVAGEWSEPQHVRLDWRSNLMNIVGFTNIGSKIVRKRNSKKELFEYCVYATWQEERQYEPGFFGRGTARQVQLSLF